MEVNIRFAKQDDLTRIVEIYNQAIRSGNSTADIFELKCVDREEWFWEHNEDKYPIYVLELENCIIGWSSISAYRKGREGLRETAEISYYIDYEFHGQGYGKQLIQYMIEDCKRLKIKNVFAILLDINQKSKNLLERFGFSQWGYMPNVVNLNGRICGHVLYGINLDWS